VYEQNLRTKVLEVSWAGRSEVVPNDGVSGDVLCMADLFSLLARWYSGWCCCYLKLAVFWFVWCSENSAVNLVKFWCFYFILRAAQTQKRVRKYIEK